MQTLKKHKALLLCFMSLFFMAGMCEEDPYVDNVLVQSINLSHSYAELRVGERLTLTAAVAPQDATTKSLSWRSHDEGVAIVDATAADEAEVIAVSPGTAVITATTKDGSGVTATCVITVTDNNNSEDPETQWSEWEFVNTGTYTYTQLWDTEDPERPVYVRSSLVDDTQLQVKVENVMYGIDLIIDYDSTTGLCHIGEGYTGYDYETYGSVYFSDLNTYTGTSDYPSYYNEETGLFTLWLVYYVPGVGRFGDGGYEYLQLDGYTQPDYSIDIEYLGCDGNTASFYITKGADVSTYKCAITTGTLGKKAALSMARDIIDGNIAYTEFDESGYHDFHLTEVGEHTLVIVSFDETGASQTYYWYNFSTSSTNQDSQWESLGMATYREDIIAGLYGIENLVYEVEIQENTETEGLYRLVNPYGPAYGYNSEGYYDDSENHYMVIDAQDPAKVKISEFYTGLDFGHGEIGVMSMVDYLWWFGEGTTEEEVLPYYGKLENGVITFPSKSLVAILDNGLYYANSNGLFAVALPDYNIPDYYYAPAAAPAQRVIKGIHNEAKAIDRAPLKKHSTNMGVITPHIRSNFQDIIK